ncbi:MAG: hypothetical protein ACM3NH_02720 [Candidatus Saccharibacteria bacterium]
MPSAWRKPKGPQTTVTIQAGNTSYQVGVIEGGRVACPHCHHKMPIRNAGFRSCYHCTWYFYASFPPVPAALEL